MWFKFGSGISDYIELLMAVKAEKSGACFVPYIALQWQYAGDSLHGVFGKVYRAVEIVRVARFWSLVSL